MDDLSQENTWLQKTISSEQQQQKKPSEEELLQCIGDDSASMDAAAKLGLSAFYTDQLRFKRVAFHFDDADPKELRSLASGKTDERLSLGSFVFIFIQYLSTLCFFVQDGRCRNASGSYCSPVQANLFALSNGQMYSKLVSFFHALAPLSPYGKCLQILSTLCLAHHSSSGLASCPALADFVSFVESIPSWDSATPPLSLITSVSLLKLIAGLLAGCLKQDQKMRRQLVPGGILLSRSWPII